MVKSIWPIDFNVPSPAKRIPTEEILKNPESEWVNYLMSVNDVTPVVDSKGRWWFEKNNYHMNHREFRVFLSLSCDKSDFYIDHLLRALRNALSTARKTGQWPTKGEENVVE